MDYKKLILDVITIIVIVVTLFPLLVLTLNSFKEQSEILRIPPTILPEKPTLSNYFTAVERWNIPRLFLNSLIIASGVTIFSVPLSTLAGYTFAKFHFKGKEKIFAFMLTKLMLPQILLVIPWYTIMIAFNLVDNLIAVILPAMAQMQTVFFMRQYIEPFPNDLIDSARIDGASELRIFFKIICPLITPAIITATIRNFLSGWGAFLWPLIILVSGDKFPIQVAIVGATIASGAEWPHYGMLAAVSLIYAIPTIVLYLLFARRFVESVVLTGLKA